MITVVGWDVGGANVKASWLAYDRGRAHEIQVASRPFEIWREKDRLPEVLQLLLADLRHERPPAMALTMTAELADVFSTKREGVLFVMDCVGAAFPDCEHHLLSLSGQFVPLERARTRPLEFAAANWLATALLVATDHPNCLLVDIGSTTTDVIPIIDGRVAAQGRTDLERLIAGELVYTGALRTHLAAIVHSVPVCGHLCPVSSEYFAISGDVHLLLGHLQPSDYVCPTPDGRPPTKTSARQRLARLVCADLEALSPAEVDQIARHVHQAQLRQIVEAMGRVLSRSDSHLGLPVIAVGLGAFLAIEAGRQLGLTLVTLESGWGGELSAAAPSVAVAQLLAREMEALKLEP